MSKEAHLSARTLLVMIQVLEAELQKYTSILKKEKKESGFVDHDDYMWAMDLDIAAEELEVAYKTVLKTQKITGYPTYEKLVERFRKKTD